MVSWGWCFFNWAEVTDQMIDPMEMNQMITSVRVDIDIEDINIGMDLSYPAIGVDIGMEEIRFEPWKKV